MRNYLYIIMAIVVAMFHTSCNAVDDLFGSSSNDELQLSSSALTFENRASSTYFTITTSDDWTITNDSEEWCTVDKSYGSGDAIIAVSVAENATGSDRQALIVISSESSSTTLTVVQYEEMMTNYQSVSWDDVTISSYNPDSGNIQFTINDGSEVDYTVGKAIILPASYDYQVRVIESVTILGSSVAMSTSQGNMCNLFKNVDFTLMTYSMQSTSESKTDGRRIITPSEISVQMADGRYETIYKESDAATRSSYGSLISLSEDFSDNYLLSGDGYSIGYEKLYYDLVLDAVFNFSFGESSANGSGFEGVLNDFELCMDGSINADILMEYIFNGEYSSGGTVEDSCIKEDIIDKIQLTFSVAGVPVVISISTDLCKTATVDAAIDATFTAGCNLSSSAQFGLYYDGDTAEPFKSFNLSYSLYNPTFSLSEGEIEATGSIYPRFSFMFYDAPGPWVEPMPYAKTDINAGAVSSFDLGYIELSDSYMGWSAETYSGMMYRAGLNSDFFDSSKETYQSEILQVTKKNLFTASTKVEIVSPTTTEHVEYAEGEEIVVSLKTYSNNLLNGADIPCDGVYVMFETEGEVSSTSISSDENGELEVRWTPQSEFDALTAVIVDSQGEVVSKDALYLSVDEREILKQIYYAAGGDNWTEKDNWCTDAPLSEWYGVSTYTTGYDDSGAAIESVKLLDFTSNNVTGSFSVAGLRYLQNLYCINNQISGIDANGCYSLQRIDGSNNQITEVDVSGCSALLYLFFETNSLASLDLSGCSSLKTLYCYDNPLTSLDLSECSGINSILCYDTSLTTLDVSECSSLTTLLCNNSSLTTLDVSECSNLWNLYCYSNPLTTIELGSKYWFSTLHCYDTLLTTLDVSGCKNLSNLYCYDTPLTTLDLSSCSDLSILYCYDNPLTTLNVNGCSDLEELYCYGTPLTTLDVSGCIDLEILHCYENSLTSLDVSDCISLSDLACYSNALTSLDVSGCSSLSDLACYDNSLTTLNVVGCSKLSSLACYDNSLTTLNVVGCSKLSSFYCYNNSLTSLDMGIHGSMATMHCYNNSLTTLDVSKCYNMSELDCSSNSITTIDASECRNLDTLLCLGNYIDTINLYYLDPTTLSCVYWGEHDAELYTEPTHKNGYQYPAFYYTMSDR